MFIKKMRQNLGLSQEQLAETTGISLRTLQRIESGQQVSPGSLKTLADFFGVSVESLQNAMKTEETRSTLLGRTALDAMNRHRAGQLIIFVVTFFVCISQWLGYYAQLTPESTDANLWTILSYITQIAIGAAIFAYIFNRARITFVWSYYAVTAAFFLCAIALDFWIGDMDTGASKQFMYAVFYTLMMLTLLVFHVLQMALSLKGESAVLVQQ